MLPAILSAGGSILSSIMGNKQAKSQEKLQKEFAQSGIQWKVADAKKAGIHPLYALGASTHSYSPVSVGTDFASVGQNLGRAMDATRTGAQRHDAVSKTVADLQLKRMGLENELLASQIAVVRQTASSPPMAGSSYLIPGQTASGLVTPEAQKIHKRSAEMPAGEAGSIPDIGYSQTGPKSFVPVPSEAIAERMEDNAVHQIGHFMRNNIPGLNRGSQPPPASVYKLGPFEYWSYENGAWRAKSGSSRSSGYTLKQLNRLKRRY